MKYFNPSYWFKLWVLSAPLFNSKNEGIYAKSIDNQNIKDWASNNTTEISLLENQELSLTNNQTSLLNLPSWNSNLTTHNEHHKHRHQKSRNRIKKQVTPNPTRSNVIFKLNEKLIINRDNPREYQSSLQSVINELVQNNILLIIPETDNQLYVLNPESNYGYFRLPVAIRREEDGQSLERSLELVFSSDALYVQGFIINERGSHIGEVSNYYYFNATLGTSSGQYNSQLERIPNTNPIMLRHIGNAYRDLLPREDTNIYWINIFNAFLRLTNDINVNTEYALGSLALSLGRIILVTAEVLRFREWENNINRELINNRNFFSIGLNNNNYQLLISWGQSSQTHLTLFLNRIYNEYGETDLYLRLRNEINQRLNRIRDYNERNFVTEVLNHLENTSIDTVTTLLFGTGLRILLLRSSLLDKINRNCRRGKRDLQNTYWNKKFCDWKPEIDKIQGAITVIKVLDKNNESDNLKEGTIYVGTNNGVYLINIVGQVNKFDGLNFPIKEIILDGKGSAYVTHKNKECEIYHLNLIGWGSEKTNMESCDLKNELKIYYNDDKSSKEIYFAPSNSIIRKKGIFTLNLGKINPVDNYKKIEFLGNYYSDGWGTRIKWGSNIYDPNNINNKGQNSDIGTVIRERKNKLSDNIKNYKVTDDITMSWIENHYAPLRIQSLDDRDFIAWVEGLQKFGFTFYWENNNYYLQMITFQYLDWRASEASLECWMKIGNGIKLYNDDNTFETQIPNPNDRKKRNIISNATKWTDEFTQSINHEQHLPITNNANFVTNNITSL